jgi:hypothetical protein
MVGNRPGTGNRMEIGCDLPTAWSSESWCFCRPQRAAFLTVCAALGQLAPASSVSVFRLLPLQPHLHLSQAPPPPASSASISGSAPSSLICIYLRLLPLQPHLHLSSGSTPSNLNICRQAPPPSASSASILGSSPSSLISGSAPTNPGQNQGGNSSSVCLCSALIETLAHCLSPPSLAF